MTRDKINHRLIVWVGSWIGLAENLLTIFTFTVFSESLTLRFYGWTVKKKAKQKAREE